jgi:transcriptional regulator with XRE-family HTH domain
MQDSTLPQLVQETRKERGLSQRELAKLVGASAVLVSKIENKRRSVEPELLSRIAVATGYPVAWYSDPSTRSNPLPQLSWMLDRQGKVVHFYGALELVSRAEAFGSTLDDWSDRFPDVVNLHKQVQPGECSGQIANVFGRRFYIVVARQSTYPYYCYGTAILLLV